MSSNNSDELERLRFKFYVDRGYFPSDNTIKQLLNRTKTVEKIPLEIVTNEEDEYALFINEIKKLESDTNIKKNIEPDNNNNKTIKKSRNRIKNTIDNNNIVIENYEEQKNEFLSAIKNHYYSYKNKLSDTNIIKKHTFKKPDISKAIPRITIDLHGMTRDKAYIYIKDSIEDAIIHRESPMLVIHGKGLHNEHGRSLVKESLDEYIVRDNKQLIEYYHKAPKHLGGLGATLLYLKF